MPTIPPSAAMRAVIAPAFALLMLGLPAQAQSADGGLFDLLFAPARPAPQAAPVQYGESGGYGQVRNSIRRSIRRPTASQRPKTRYAALPKAEPLQIKITDRQTPIDLKAGPAAAFLRDETLRPGDIVVMKDGPKVFVGKTDARHTVRDFESVGRSDFIDRRTRVQLAAMMLPVGAMPADQARRMLARAPKVIPSSADQPLKAEATAMRVINPWQTAP